jgi:hypothetical protein
VVSGHLHTPAPLPLQKQDPETQWIGSWVAQEPVWAAWRRENSSPTETRTATPSFVQPVASRYTDCAIVVLVTKCSSEKARCFWGTHRSHLQGGRVSQGRNQHKQTTKHYTCDDSTMWSILWHCNRVRLEEVNINKKITQYSQLPDSNSVRPGI